MHMQLPRKMNYSFAFYMEDLWPFSPSPNLPRPVKRRKGNKKKRQAKKKGRKEKTHISIFLSLTGLLMEEAHAHTLFSVHTHDRITHTTSTDTL